MINARPAQVNAEADVCLVVEGCYPFVTGGVANWLDWLMRSLPDMQFKIVALVADERPMTSKYEFPPNVVGFEVLPLTRRLAKPIHVRKQAVKPSMIAALAIRAAWDGDLDAFAELDALVGARGAGIDYAQLMNSRFAWDVMLEAYRALAPSASFPDFFWAWRTLLGGLFAVLKAPIPPARCYHAISTGYAGLFAARAAIVTGRRVAVTEHGIYTNERRIDLTMAEWIPDSIGISLTRVENRTDLRQFWIRVFESYARLCYAASTRITTLYGENQTFQRALGALEGKLEVIPNGIELARFSSVTRLQNGQPTVALIGRVVPIKDVKTYIAAIAKLRASIPDIRALMIGPTDEDPEYTDQCKRMVEELGLGECFTFTGRVNIAQYLPHIDVVALTSISEAQPLVLLEAGAASIPCVTTDVGSCREIIEGLPDEGPRLGPAGRVTPPMDPDAFAEALAELLLDAGFRRACGERLRLRVERYFTSEASASRYATMYQGLILQ